MPSHATDYAAWDAFEDSDDERKKEEAAAKKAKADEAKARAKARADAAAASGNIDGLPEGMSRDEFMKAYSKVINPNGSKKPYKFPDTAPEQDAICTAAADLKKRGNELYAKGEYVEAAKLYEQAVLKFSDWYAEAFADEDERARVLPIKLPSHLNLAACSWRLGNHEHAVLHCTQARLRCPPLYTHPGAPLSVLRRSSTMNRAILRRCIAAAQVASLSAISTRRWRTCARRRPQRRTTPRYGASCAGAGRSGASTAVGRSRSV